MKIFPVSMKRIITLFCALLLTLTPLKVQAEIGVTWSPDARDKVQYYFEAWTDAEPWTNAKCRILKERSSARYTITYAPEKLNVKAYANHISVNADVTSASRAVVIQWSTDKNFNKNVQTMTYKNPKYKGPVYCYLKYDYKRKSIGCDYVADRTFKQKDRILGYRHLQSHKEYDVLVVNYQSTNAVRKRVTNFQSYKIPVKKKKKYYVRMYLVYSGTKELYSRRVVVKVK